MKSKKTSPQKSGLPKQFAQFAPKKSNAAKKEQFKQEKRKWKKEREDFFDEKRGRKSAFGNRQNEIHRSKKTIPEKRSLILPKIKTQEAKAPEPQQDPLPLCRCR